MRTTAVFLSLGLLGTALALAAPAPAAAQYGAGARIWVENDREYFRYGDRLRVNFSTSANSYVAVVHVDPEGYLDFVYPTSPWDNEFVRGGRVYSLNGFGAGNGLLVRGGSGIGYLYVIASPVPLDYTHFSGGRGSGWDWSYAGRRVSGDPFWAMEQITRMLLPRWSNVPYAVDYYTYFIGGRQRYPSYACSSYGGGWGWGYSPAWTSYYGSCGRLDRFLRDDPYYFDTRRYRGDRNRYYRDYRDHRDWDPRHAYKVNPARTPARSGVRAVTPEGTSRAPGGAEAVTPGTRPVLRYTPERSPGSAVPERAAPRPTERPTERAAPIPAPRTREPAPQRAEPAPRPEPAPRVREPEPRRAQPAPRPQPAPRAREPEPRRAQPAPRPQPAPRAREPEPRRAQPATRSTSSGASRSSGSSESGSSSSPRSRRGD